MSNHTAATNNRDATFDANIATLADWAKQCSGGFFTIKGAEYPRSRYGGAWDSVLVRADGKPMGYFQNDPDQPVHGVQLDLVVPFYARLTRRNRKAMAAVYEAIRHVVYGRDTFGNNGRVRADLDIESETVELNTLQAKFISSMSYYVRVNRLEGVSVR